MIVDPIARAALRAGHSFLPLLLAAAGCAASAEPAPAAAFAVSPAQLQTLGVRLHTLAPNAAAPTLLHSAKVVLPPGREQVLSAPVGGVVERLFVSGQELVRPGQPLLRLASPEYAELQLRLMDAASRHELAARALAREQRLLEEGVIAERRVLEAQAAERSERARLQQAEAALRLAGADAALMQRLRAGGPLEQGLTLRAKVAGQLTALELRPGQRVREADALLHIAEQGELWLEVQLDARPAALPPRAELTVPGRAIKARVLSLAGQVSEGQTLTLRARVSEGGALLRPGEVLQVQLPAAAAKDAWVLPLAALARQDEQAYVFVRSEQGFRATPVQLLASGGDSVQVRGPLQAGQQVAASAVVALMAAWQGKSGGQ